MTQELKERIEQIRRGEVPEGYKRTKVGILPGEWEITKLNLISSHVTNKNTNGEVQTTFTNSATQGVIKQTDYFDKEISSRESITSYYIVQENDYIYNPRISVSAPCGPINKSHFPDNGVVSPLYTVFKMNDGLQENKYIEFYFKSSLWYKYMCGVANYGARHDRMNITNDDLFGMPIPFPPLAEQEKIAEILSAQDKLIELQQKKIEELKRLKKVYLSKLFPKKGCNVPEIRFPGFTDPWEQRKLGEIFEEYSEKGHPELPALTIIQGGGTIRRDESDRSLQYDKASLANYKMVNDGDFIVHLRSFEGGLEKATTLGIISPAYHTFHGEGTDSRFYYSYFRSPKFIDQDLKPHVYGIRDGRSIDIEGMKTIEIPWTSFDEQKAIGDYIDTLDNLITLHQRKLEEMKKLKKALMQLLLTGIVRV
ncbi:MAG: restriction endonuclease subunit S [Acetatifactor sp.]